MSRPQNEMKSYRRRGVTVFLVLILIPVLLGFAALTIDVGVLYNTRADLQNAADAGALAATSMLASDRSPAGVLAARNAAMEVIQKHVTLGESLTADPNADVVFGQLHFNEATNRYDFTPTESFPDATRITMRRAAGSANGPTPLFFAGIFGKRTANVEATATSGLTGIRDIALVIDLTYTMTNDSMLFHAVSHTAENGTNLPGMQINLRDIWCALNGPVPNRPYIPGDETQTQYANDTGPTIGVMNTWGAQIVPNTYNPTTDSGLWYIPNNAPCTVGAITMSLTARGYNATQRNALMNSSSSSTWANRAAVMIGLATWHPSNSSDTSVGNSELIWAPLPSYASGWNWSDYISFMSSSSSYMADGDSRLRFRFGLKTFTNFLLENPQYDETNILWNTPQQPLQAIKDAVQTFVDVLVDGGNPDQVSLEVFDNIGRHQVDLTEEVQSAADRLYQLQAAHWQKTTNLGGGIREAIEELTSVRARANAQKIMIVLSDGQPNTNENGYWSGYGSAIASGYALTEAHAAAAQGIKIYTITVGWDANRSLMQSIAAAANGEEFFAAGDPRQYAAKLRQIFFHLAGGDTAMLVE